MKVCILGIARSGTTALYSLLQEIMLENHKSVDFVYEPFLWDKNIFNKKYEEACKAFKYLNSISLEGIYQHQTLPLFINKPDQFQSNKYLRNIFRSQPPQQPKLIKFTRANGRLLLLHKICPDCKFVFIIRNPLDSANSVLTKFSYYGGEFHHDDYPRFINEINSIYGLDYSAETFQTQIEKELMYWYYMNRFAIEILRKSTSNFLILTHEYYRMNREDAIRKICAFLNYDFKYHYFLKAEQTGTGKGLYE